MQSKTAYYFNTGTGADDVTRERRREGLYVTMVWLWVTYYIRDTGRRLLQQIL